MSRGQCTASVANVLARCENKMGIGVALILGLSVVMAGMPGVFGPLLGVFHGNRMLRLRQQSEEG